MNSLLRVLGTFLRALGTFLEVLGILLGAFWSFLDLFSGGARFITLFM